MRVTSLVRTALALGALAGATQAQIVFTGVLEKAQLASFCQEETHYVTCTSPSPGVPTGVLVKSSTLELEKYEGKVARFTAQPRGVECTIYDITDAQLPPPTWLDLCGNPVPGCPMRARVQPTGVIGQWFLWVSTSPTFLPLDPVTGTWMLGFPFYFLGAGGTAGADAAFDFTLPPNPNLTGVSLYFQGAFRDIGPVGPLQLTDPRCFTILGPSPPCFLPNC